MHEMRFSLRCLVCLAVLYLANATMARSENTLLVAKHGFVRIVEPGIQPDATVYYAPVGAVFTIENTVEDKDKGSLYVIRFSRFAEKTRGSAPEMSDPGFEAGSEFGMAKIPRVETDVNYYLRQVALPRYDYNVGPGINVSGLTIPFRLQLSDGNITTGGSIGACVGYRTYVFGATMDVALAGGLSLVPTTSVNATTIQSTTGLTLAGGIIFEVRNPFQVGVLIGTDLVGSNKYEYNGKSWITFGIGYVFIQ